MYTYQHFISDSKLLQSLKTKGDRTKKTIPLTCNHCRNEYLMNRNTIKTALSNNSKFNFCSNMCCGLSRNFHVPDVTCKRCGNIFTKSRAEISNNGNDFCNRTCAAIYNNSKREKKPKSTIKKVIEKFPCSPVYLNTCQKSGVKFYYKSWRRYHPSLVSDREDYRRLCGFQFSISQFPEWFDGKIIKEHGWYSTPGSNKRGINNKNGVSRDHLISVSYGFLNNIPPEIIRHPANCDLKLHKDNNKKNSNCEITIDELYERIKKFEILYPDWFV